MNVLMIVLRIIHIFAGVFWVGFAAFNVFFLQPSVRTLGPDGQKVMQHLTQKTRLLATVYIAATLNVIAGLLMYWILSGFRLSFMTSGYGLALTIGGIAGIIAWFLALIVVRGIFNQMQAVGKEIQAQGRPPSPEQGATLQALVVRLGRVGQIGLAWLAISLLGMAVARYLTF